MCVKSQRTLYIAKINELQLQLQEGLQAMEERNAEFQKTLLRVEAEHQTVVQNLHVEVDRIRVSEPMHGVIRMLLRRLL